MVPRGLRFQVHVPMLYRALGESGWRRATTENISKSGVLFHGEEPLGSKTPVDLRFQTLVLPPVESTAVADVFCRADIVRIMPATGRYARPKLAARIHSYEFRPARGELDPRDDAAC
jgi:PilZ domain-containing protein